MRSGIGGLLAQTGANIGSQVGSAYGQLGTDIQGMLSGVGAKRRQKKQTQEVQELLAKYQNNPAQLNAVSAKYASEGNDALAQVFAEAAQRAVDAQAKKTQQAGQAGLVGLGQVLQGAAPQERQAILRDASGSLTAQGITAEQIMSTAATAQEEAKNQQAITAARNLVVEQAQSLEMPELARLARNTNDINLLTSLGTKLMDKTLETMPEISSKGRMDLLRGVGYSTKEAQTIVAKKPSRQEFQEYLKLQKGDVKMYIDGNGNPVTYRTTDYGMVAVDGKLVDPATLNIREAPNQQVVENVSSNMADQIAKLGAENFNELYGQATKSEESIRSIDNIIGDVDTMFSGSLANVALQVNKFMKSAGIPVPDAPIEKTEVFVAESAKRVADYITNLGAGTGLSDKDLEFTRKVVAGDVTLDAETIKRMLKEFRQASERKINNYMKTRSKIEGRLRANEEGALDFYLPILVPQPSALSSNAQKYLR